MKLISVIKKTEEVFAFLLMLSLWVFFSFFYDAHFRDQEQSYIFEWTWNFFISYTKQPGGISGWLGGFITQFFYFSHTGGIFIVLFCIGIWWNLRSIARRLEFFKGWWGLLLLFVVFSCILHCYYLYRFTGAVSILLAITALNTYLLIKSALVRRCISIPLILFLYWTCAGPYLGIAISMALFEYFIFKNRIKTIEPQPSGYIYVICALYIITGLLIPIIIQRFFLTIPWKIAFWGKYIYETAVPFPEIIFITWFFIPILLLIACIIKIPVFKHNFTNSIIQILIISAAIIWGISKHADFFREHVYTMIHMVHAEKWDETIDYAKKHNLTGRETASLVNLALAQKGKLLDSMFEFRQYGLQGLIPDWNDGFWTPSVSHKVSSIIALANKSIGVSRSCGFMANLFGTNNMMPLLLQDQIKLEIVNGEYRVAGKMLRPLENTLFYRKWAENIRGLLNDTVSINNEPWVKELRYTRFTGSSFDGLTDFASRKVLGFNDTYKNTVSYEYFMADMLLTRRIMHVIEFLPMLNQFGYKHIPVHIQQALLAYNTMPEADKDILKKYPISKQVGERYRQYMQAYTKNQKSSDFSNIMHKDFGDTYWYFVHFIAPIIGKYDTDKESEAQR